MILLALAASTARIFTPLVAKYRTDIETYLSNSLGSKIEIGHLKASWYGIHPVLQLNHIIVRNLKHKRKVLTINQVAIGLNLWRSIWHWRFQPGLLMINGADIQILRVKKAHYQIHGIDSLTIDKNQSSSINDKTVEKILSWFFKQNEVRLKNIRLQLKTPLIKVNSNFLSLKLINDVNGHHFEGISVLKNYPSSKVRVIGNVKGEYLNQLSGQFYIIANRLPLNLINEVAQIDNFKVDSGQGDFELWGDITPKLTLLTQTKIKIKNLVVRNLKYNLTKKIKFFKGTLAYQYAQGKTKIYSKHIELSPYLKFNSDHGFLFEKQSNKYLLQASHINISFLQQWYSFYGKKIILPLKKYHLHGFLKNVQIQIKGHKPVLLFAEFKNIAIHNDNQLSLRNLNGQIYVDQSSGYLNLDTKNTTLSLPAPYSRAFTFKKVMANFRWKKLVNLWRITSPKLYIELDNLSLSQRFSFDWTGNFKTSYLSLDSNFSGNLIEELKPYLPKTGMNTNLRRWLENSIISLPKLTGHAQLKGLLGDLPFDKSNGDFNVQLNVEDAKLKFHPKWPVANHLDARIIFNKRDMLADINQAMLGENKISNLSVLIKPLGEYVQYLFLKGSGNFESQKVLDYMLKSPLNKKLQLLNTMSFIGFLNLKLNLTLPLYPENKHSLLAGDIYFDKNILNLYTKPLINLTQLDGPIRFNEDGITNSKLTAELFDYPLSFSIENTLNKDSSLKINANGIMSFSKLKQKFNYLNRFYGLFDYHTSIDIPSNREDVKVEFKTNLFKTQIKLPEPLSKKINLKQPLSLKLKLKEKEYLVDLKLENSFSSMFKFLKVKKQFILNKAKISFNKNTAVLANNSGVYIDGIINELSVEPWLNVYNKQVNNLDKTLFSNSNLYIDLLLKKIKLYQYNYKNLSLKVTPEMKNYRIGLENNLIKGHITLPLKTKQDTIMVDLDYLHLNSSKAKHQNLLEPNQLIPLNINIRSLFYNNKLLGSLNVKTRKLKQAFVIHSFTLKSPAYELKLIGQWQKIKQQHYSEFEGFCQSSSLTKFFKKLHIEPIIESKNALLKFKLNSNNSLFNLELDNIVGDLSLSVKNGRITHLSKDVERKLGLGKLISILSLQTLPRRLVLDFSDLAHKGFSFDVFKGDYKLQNTNLSTSNTFMDGAVSYVSMNGTLNLSKKLYDITLQVNPHITASLPIVATIAGGPIAGIAAWVASKIINQGMSKVISYTYKISGPWQKPIVQQISISKVKK